MSDQSTSNSQPQKPSEGSPLAEADPTSLEEFFNMDPLLMSDADAEKILTKLREDWRLFVATEAAGKRPPRTKAVGELKKRPTLKDLDIDLSALGLAPPSGETK
jgi:hypothetical protein